MMIRDKEQGGFTLIEVAITLLILSIFLAAAVALFQKSEQQRKMKITLQNMKVVEHALSVYVEGAGRLPCPAQPDINDETFGWEWGVTRASLEIDSGGRPTGTCATTGGANPNTIGIVPFQSINLPVAAVRDGWGRYFTYAVSPIFTQATDSTIAGVEAATQIHAQCRTAAWVGDTDTFSSFKARFCCAGEMALGTLGTNTDLEIRLTAGGRISPLRNNAAANFAAMTTLFVNGAGQPAAPTAQIIAPAFVLVSHGENGDGAFLGDNTTNRMNSGQLVGANENENGAGAGANARDRIYLTGPRNLRSTAADYFDDVVLWRTQDGIMAANGTSSCQYP